MNLAPSTPKHGSWPGPAGLLAVGGLLIGAGGLVGVVHTDDHSPLGMASGAVWLVLLPAIVAVAVTAWKPVLGLAVAAGAGLAALAGLLADLALLTGPDAVIRPDLLYEVSDRAQPFTPAVGGVLVVAGDLVMVVGGGLAARRLGAGLSSATERIFDTDLPGTETDLPATDAAGSGAGLFAQALESTERRLAAIPVLGRPVEQPVKNNRLIGVGFVGALALLTASLGLPYSGGYLAARYLPAELGLWGIGAALLLAVLAIIAVLTAAVLPRPLAVALLGGVGLAAAVPFLIALAVRTVGPPVRLTTSVWWGLAGALVLAAAGLLARAQLVPDHDAEPSTSAGRRLNTTGAVLTLLVAVAAVAGWRLPQLRYNGGADPKLADGFAISAPLALPFLLAAMIPLVGGLLWLVPGTARAGRAVAAVGPVALVFALGQSLDLLGQVVNSASVPNAGFAPPRWSPGPGLWWGVAGFGIGLAAMVVAVTASRQATEFSPLIAADDPLAGPRTLGTVVATSLTVITIVAMTFPIYRTTAGSSATLLVGFQVNSWGVLALAVGMIAVSWAAARANWAAQAVAYPLAGAAIASVRLVIPASVRAQDGFSLAPGLFVGYFAVLAFLVGAVALLGSSRRIRMTDPLHTVPALPPVPQRPATGGSGTRAPTGKGGRGGQGGRGRPGGRGGLGTSARS